MINFLCILPQWKGVVRRCNQGFTGLDEGGGQDREGAAALWPVLSPARPLATYPPPSPPKGRPQCARPAQPGVRWAWGEGGSEGLKKRQMKNKLGDLCLARATEKDPASKLMLYFIARSKQDGGVSFTCFGSTGCSSHSPLAAQGGSRGRHKVKLILLRGLCPLSWVLFVSLPTGQSQAYPYSHSLQTTFLICHY